MTPESPGIFDRIGGTISGGADFFGGLIKTGVTEGIALSRQDRNLDQELRLAEIDLQKEVLEARLAGFEASPDERVGADPGFDVGSVGTGGLILGAVLVLGAVALFQAIK